MTQFLHLGQKLGLFNGQEITGNDVGNTRVKPVSNRRPRDLQLGEQVWIAGLADHFSNTVVVGASSAEGRHHTHIESLRLLPDGSWAHQIVAGNQCAAAQRGLAAANVQLPTNS
jgi:hypothetical protein